MMNDSKWIKLLEAIESLDFPPAFMCKTIKEVVDDEFERRFLIETPSYIGNWQPFYFEGMPIFMKIEYILVKPLLGKHQGQLVDDHIFDQTEQFRKILMELNISFSEQNHCFKINAYLEFQIRWSRIKNEMLQKFKNFNCNLSVMIVKSLNLMF